MTTLLLIAINSKFSARFQSESRQLFPDNRALSPEQKQSISGLFRRLMRQEIASLAGVCPRNVCQVKLIREKTHPQLIEALRSGT